MKKSDAPLTHPELQAFLWEVSQGRDIKEMGRINKIVRRVIRFRQKHAREQRTTSWSQPDGNGNWSVVEDDGTVLATFRREKNGKLTLVR